MALITVALLAVAAAPLIVHPVAISAATAPTNAVPHRLPAARCEPCVVMPMEGKHSLRLSLIATKRWCGGAARGAPPPRSVVGGRGRRPRGLHKRIGMWLYNEGSVQTKAFAAAGGLLKVRAAP